MTGLQIYALASPFILLAFGWGLAWWALYSDVRARRDPAASPTRPAE